EAAAEGLQWTFAPMVDIARDPRWGRIAEGAGEDTWLGSLIAAARVKGFQGNDLGAINTIAACAKHYAAYGAAQGGRDYNVVDMSLYSLHNTYLPPFKACVDAGVATFMTAFNEINGIPCSASNYLLNDILKNAWGFRGFVVTDYTSINEMVPHGYATDEKHAAQLALNAGVDMDMQGATFYNYLKDLNKEDKVKLLEIDKAVRRILSIKYDLGLFEDPYRYCDEKREAEVSFSKKNQDFANEVAKKSMVLLKNEANVLPLKKGLTIALVGPLAKDKRNLLGNWSAAGDWKKSISVWEGLQTASAGKNTIQYAKGCNLLDDQMLIQKLNGSGGDIETDARSQAEMLKEALEVAGKSDIIIAVMGESQGMSGEAASRSDINLPENQKIFLKALKASGKPIVLVLMNGRPLTLPWENENMNAIVETWFSGSMAGEAIAQILLGEYNPGAKLTISFPRSVGQIPIYYNMKNTGRPFDQNNKYTSKYLDVENTPLYPFGYGLSYTNYEYGKAILDKNKIHIGESVKINIDISNTGKMAGEEIVQLYIHHIQSGTTRPLKELKGFEKIFLEAGTKKNVGFELNSNDFASMTQDLKMICEPGKYEIMVGRNSEDLQKLNFEIIK
ncbi:MAG TPA: beta-glucosidase BglX, partial [Saprospiraceae bacterium]|nr:beta-glucosidase BglX [Saprospiraceae bacterium]